MTLGGVTGYLGAFLLGALAGGAMNTASNTEGVRGALGCLVLLLGLVEVVLGVILIVRGTGL